LKFFVTERKKLDNEWLSPSRHSFGGTAKRWGAKGLGKYNYRPGSSGKKQQQQWREKREKKVFITRKF
jgi:hypothetical protein